MKKSINKRIVIKNNLLAGLFVLIMSCAEQKPQPETKTVVLDIDTTSIAKIQPTMYGIFYEDINFAADGGLYAEMIKNRSFEFDNPKMGWNQPNSDRHSHNNESGIASIIKYSEASNNHNYCRITVKNDSGYVIINEGFRGMGIKKDAKYNLSLLAAKSLGDISKINISFIDSLGTVLGSTSVVPTTSDWQEYETQLVATKTEEKASLQFTFEGKGSIDLDMVSMFPEDTWKGRKKGLRKDLVQLLDDLDPGFLRFPGGCIVEGRTLAKRYQWKKTVGNIDQRELLMNRWNMEFGHRPTPDYFQSFGLGFFEYFQLAEDLGAEPLPILSCGMACQFNTGELVAMEDLDPYIQDAIDLIEFANGSIETPWGKVRKDMGHPEPFHMKYIGVGNEQWGPDYIDRFKVFQETIKAKYPEMIIVTGSGPSSDGDFFEYGWEELRKLNAEIVDEHYYKNPEWFLENAGRYDDYDRNGPKVFAGEFAAQSVTTVSPENRNNWNCALSEAAFMTGLERNADIVHLTSYAPLMAHAEGWQWTPDLIWFNNLVSYGTANYYVQRLFSNNKGTDLISITEEGKSVIGANKIYASAVKSATTNELIIKLVNVADTQQEVQINLANLEIGSQVKTITLKSANLEDENSFESPKNISPIESEISIEGNDVVYDVAPHSITVLKLKVNE